MATVTVEWIAEVHASLTTAVSKTHSRSRLPEEEQDRLLAESCGLACGLLEGWLASDIWDGLRFSGEADFVGDQEHFNKLLPTLKNVLERASQRGMTVPRGRVDEARKALRAAAQLFLDAEAKVVA